MPQFYHGSITDKSFQLLTELKKQYRFILIGGWAVFVYTRSLKSKDIDIILDYGELGKLRKEFLVEKNERLKKYEIKTGEFDIDVYVAHYSDLGLDADIIREMAVAREGFLVPPPELLFILKLYAWHHRRGSMKGRKDELDIVSLARLPEFNWHRYLGWVKEHHFEEFHHNAIALFKKTTSVPELSFNEQQASRWKKQIFQKMQTN